MEIILDIHTHSHYSRATSKDCTLEGLYKWGKIKGIHVIGTGDFTHPLWFKELQEKLEPAEDGLYKLKDEIAKKIDATLPDSIKNNTIRFILTVEISCIYSKYSKVRKLHNLVVSPDFETVSNINARLDKIGNLYSDGRPILGIDSKDLLQIIIDANSRNVFIPAHIWTPWFGMFGSKSGFDSIQETFEELTPHVHGIETGLSSDPYMNWRIKELQTVAVISASDAHSPPKLGREATIMNCDLTYDDIFEGIKANDKRLAGTIEFYPEEGKYHFDGHRVCNIMFTPEQTRDHNGICPVCHRPLTIGVEYRVEELADTEKTFHQDKTVEYIIPLIEILGKLNHVGPASKKVQQQYEHLYTVLGDEFSILRKLSIQHIKDYGFEKLSEVIDLMRKKEIKIIPGYDGVYGTIELENSEDISKQISLL